MGTDLYNVSKNIKTYFKKHLPQYTVREVRRKSNHPDDSYLYMVSAEKDDGTYAVFTSWNESTQTLNHGHYGLPSMECCEQVFSKYQSRQQYFAVYKCSQNARFRLFVTNSEKKAEMFCKDHHWELTDENNFVWELEYHEIK